MKVFLDDERATPIGFVRVRGYEECVRLLRENKGNVEVLSLDHDLGEMRTGFSVCKWLVENEYYDGLQTVIVHSANPIGAKRMLQYLDDYLPESVELLELGVNKEYQKFERIGPVK